MIRYEAGALTFHILLSIFRTPITLKSFNRQRLSQHRRKIGVFCTVRSGMLAKPYCGSCHNEHYESESKFYPFPKPICHRYMAKVLNRQ